jgi:hypothetical protein
MLLTLSSGVTGYTTIHAGSAGQALARQRFVCQLAETSAGCRSARTAARERGASASSSAAPHFPAGRQLAITTLIAPHRHRHRRPIR